MKRNNIELKLSVGVIFLASFLSNFDGFSQQNVTVDLSNSYQTIQGFGASDAWNIDPVGKYWNLDQKEKIAKLLFSTEIIGENPSGIGLSRWRFNIGGGSVEQGGNSNISKEERRAECFIEKVETVNGQEVVTYNWNKQIGQQWFLNAAKQYNVSQLVAFANSPPRFYTKNGRTNSDNTDRYGTTNLASANYDRYTDFLTTVLKHFSDEGITFSQISPINEPQYPWDSEQEGCPWKHNEVYTLVDKLNRDILAKGLTTKILLSEAADYRYLTGIKDDADKSNIIDNYFDKNSSYYMGNFSQVLPGIGSHSYWINGSDNDISTIRQSVRTKMNTYNNLELYQTEYNLLNQFYNDKTTNAVFLAKIIYSDLEIAGVSIWDYWTAVERERWSQLNRFYLLRLIPGGGDYASLNNTGTVETDKNLWALGNFSRFIRPGYKRVKTTGANNLNGLMGVSFISPDNSELVTVYVNWSDNSISVKENLTNLPLGTYVDEAEVFITNANNDLRKASNHALNNNYSVPSKSVVTLRIPIKKIVVCSDKTSNNKIEAEDYCSFSGVELGSSSEGTLNLSQINANDWASYSGVNMTGMRSINVRVAGNNSGNSIEVRLDAVDGPIIGEVILSATNGFQNWVTDSASLNLTSGIHDLYLVFKGGSGSLFNLNWFGLSDKDVITSISKEADALNIYPNPTSGLIYLDNLNSHSYELLNQMGERIFAGQVSEDNFQIDLEDLSAGIYFLKIGESEVRKIIKK